MRNKHDDDFTFTNLVINSFLRHPVSFEYSGSDHKTPTRHDMIVSMSHEYNSNYIHFLLVAGVLLYKMLSKRTTYEIQKPISPTKPGSKNSRSSKKITTTSSAIEASNSFNYSRSRAGGPSSITSLAASNNNTNFVRRSTKQPKMGIPVMTSTPTRTSVIRNTRGGM